MASPATQLELVAGLVRIAPHAAPPRDGPALTDHARERLRQRGYRDRDVETVREHGSRVEEGWVLSRNDARAAVQRLQREIARIERLSGTAVIVSDDGNVVKTVYRPGDRTVGRMLKCPNRSHRTEFREENRRKRRG